jgi:hypothetical protein
VLIYKQLILGQKKKITDNWLDVYDSNVVMELQEEWIFKQAEISQQAINKKKKPITGQRSSLEELVKNNKYYKSMCSPQESSFCY